MIEEKIAKGEKSLLLTFFISARSDCWSFNILVLLPFEDGTIGIGIATATVGLVAGGIAALVLKRR